MILKTIQWTGLHCEIPNYGIVTTGSTIKLPVDIANSFVEQGKAIIPADTVISTETRKRKVKEEI